jgi:hypothetical protein
MRFDPGAQEQALPMEFVCEAENTGTPGGFTHRGKRWHGIGAHGNVVNDGKAPGVRQPAAGAGSGNFCAGILIPAAISDRKLKAV